MGRWYTQSSELARSGGSTTGKRGQVGPEGQANSECHCAKGQGARQRTLAVGKGLVKRQLAV